MSGASAGYSRASTATRSSACGPRSSRSPRAIFCASCSTWQRVTPDARMEGPDAVDTVVAQLEGFEAPAGAWESEILPARVAGYELALARRPLSRRARRWTRLSRAPHVPTAASALRRRCAPRRSRCSRVAMSPIGPHSPRRTTRRSCSPGAQAVARLHPAARRVVLRRARRRHRPAAHAGGRGAGGARRARRREFRQLRRLARSCSCHPPNGRPLASGRRRRRTAAFGMEDAGRWALARRRAAFGFGWRQQGRSGRASRPHLAAALRRRVLAAARARSRVAAAVARSAARLSPARGARRDSRRPVRRRLRRRAVRAPGCGRDAARDPAQEGHRRLALALRPPIRSTSSAFSRPARGSPALTGNRAALSRRHSDRAPGRRAR